MPPKNTTTEVILERIENLLEKVSQQHIENKEAHESLSKKQDYTNGKVRGLLIWRGLLTGAFIIITYIIGYIITDYRQQRDIIQNHEKEDAILALKVTQLEDKVSDKTFKR